MAVGGLDHHHNVNGHTEDFKYFIENPPTKNNISTKSVFSKCRQAAAVRSGSGGSRGLPRLVILPLRRVMHSIWVSSIDRGRPSLKAGYTGEGRIGILEESGRAQLGCCWYDHGVSAHLSVGKPTVLRRQFTS